MNNLLLRERFKLEKTNLQSFLGLLRRQLRMDYSNRHKTLRSRRRITYLDESPRKTNTSEIFCRFAGFSLYSHAFVQLPTVCNHLNPRKVHFLFFLLLRGLSVRPFFVHYTRTAKQIVRALRGKNTKMNLERSRKIQPVYEGGEREVALSTLDS